MRILVSGITGLGGHLAPHLVAAGHDVVGISRDPSRVRVPVPTIAADATRLDDLTSAFEGIEVVYFMIHSLEERNAGGFAARDRLIATNVATAVRNAGVRRVVYFGVPPTSGGRAASAHVSSRFELEDILVGATPDSVALEAFTLVTPRSRSFRVLLNLVARSRVVPLPPWRTNVTQPMDVRDVFACLTAAATDPDIGGRRLRIGGPDVLSWEALLRRISTEMTSRPWFVKTPFVPPPSALRTLMRLNGGNPALMLPLLDTIGSGDMLIADNAAPALGVTPRPAVSAIAHAVEEYVSGAWRATEGVPSEAVRTVRASERNQG